MKKIIQIYDSLSSENRSSFWNVSCSFILAIITAWMGFTISLIVSDNNEKLQEKSLMYQNQVHFCSDVDAFLRICAEINLTTRKYIEPCKPILDKKSYNPNDERILLNSINNIVTYFEKNQNLIDSLSAHLYLLSQCIDAKETEQIGLNLQKFFIAMTLLSPTYEGKDNSEIRKFLETRHLNDPLSVRNKQYYYSTEIINNILDMRQKIDGINNNRGTILVKFMLVKQFIIDPINDIESVVREQYVISERKIYEHPAVKSVVLLFIIIIIGFSLWYMLVPRFFNSMINPLSSDEYKKLEIKKNEIENNYKSTLATSLLYQLKIENLETKLENFRNEAKIEERYVWILSELADLKKKEGNIQQQDIERILTESRDI